jgi:iron complex outermembrane receptor protein
MYMFRRYGLCAAVCLALGGAWLPAGLAVAQEEEARVLDRVEVTGSRIKKAEIEGQSPVLTLSRDDIERSGLTSVGDLVQRLTAAGSALNTKFNSSGNFGFPPDGGGVGAGSAQVDLRHLGSKRVLVLVDGLRWVNESSASGVGAATDLNTIPMAIIDRIEILEDGASSIYGSDAIAGVVNIITRRDFEGLRLNAYYGEFGKGDGETSNAELAFGGSGDRFSFFLGASFVEQKMVESGSREQSSLPIPGTGLAFGSSAIPAGRFIFRDPRTGVVLDLVPNAGVANPVYDFNQTGCNRTDDFHCFTSADRFNYALFNLLLTPSKRKSLFGQTRFEVSDNVTWYFKGLYNKRESLNRAAPEPFFIGLLVPTNFFMDNLFWSGSNPFNPFGVDLDASTGQLLLLGRRPIEGGPRQFFQETDTWYVATGLEGQFDLGARRMYWDLNLVRSENRANQTNFGSYNGRRIAIAMGDPATCAAEPGCVPLNVVGSGSITPAMLAYIQPVVRDQSQNDLEVLSANLSGDLFDLPAGPLAFAAGYEHRRLAGFYRPDNLTVTGEYNGVPSSPTSGKYDVDEFYLEFNVPLIARGAQRLDLSLAGRYSDYSTFGGESTGKLGLRWQVSDQFLLRGTFAEGFRAPAIGELFGSAAGFDAVIFDPCSGLAPMSAACRALGVPEGYEQPNTQIGVVTGGNPLLEPETVDSTTVGFVWSPAFASDAGWASRFDIEAGYYRHKLKGAIGPIDAQTQLNNCVASGNPASPFCQGIVRNPTGAIQSFNNRLQNLGSIETDGFDLKLFWVLPETDWGRFALNWHNSFVNDFKAIALDGSRQPQGVGVEVNDSGIPEWSSNLEMIWSHGALSASYLLRHKSKLIEDCGPVAAFPVCRDQSAGKNRLGSTTYHDAQVSWDLEWLRGTRLTLGVQNLWDKDPPICVSCSLNGYDASNYDLPGSRFWYLRAQFDF